MTEIPNTLTEKTVYIVHCVDAEGPLSERPLSLDWGLPQVNDEPLTPDFAQLESELKTVIAEHRRRTLHSWEVIMGMLRRATSEEMRFRRKDSFRGGWIYNWFCMDHIDFLHNPRQRAMGVHQVFDFYQELVRDQGMGDAVHWHFHPMSTYREAHRSATSYLNSPQLYEILCRRLLERGWFPRANRSGFQDQRPDSHWFLEQWIPFDFSNTAFHTIDPEENPDLIDGRFADWRWAPDDWRTYHPHHDHYQLEGRCRRKIARCLNVLSRFANIDETELKTAFVRANEGTPTLVAIATHDWRDLNVEVEYVRFLLQKIAPQFPDVRYRFSESVEAFNAVHHPRESDALTLRCRLLLSDVGQTT